MSNRFQFYEVVVVTAFKNVSQQSIMGMQGTVLGMGQDEETKGWNYAVSMDSTGIVWCFDEEQLTSTGNHKKREDFYSGETIKVHVEPKTGRGSIK